MDLMLVMVLVAAVALSLPLRSHARFSVVLAASLLVLAVFQTTGGRGSVSFSATYIVIGAIALVGLLSFRPGVTPWPFLPLIIYIGFGTVLLWDRGGASVGGTVNLLFAVAAWAAGSFIGYLSRREPSAQRTVVVIILCVVLFELAVTLVQLAGGGIFAPEGRTGELEGGRANGTYSHPSSLGKVLTLLLVLLLPASRTQDRSTRRMANLAIVLALLPIIISMSRANMVAAGAMILAWSLLQPREKFFARRFALPAAGGIVVLVFLDSILERFGQSTGERDHFMAVALEQLSRTPVFGVGPGKYIETVGRFDPLTAEGWPVHNIFVLQAVELGIVGAAMFFLPILAVFVRGLRRARMGGAGGDFSRSVVAYLPAFVAIGWTGWGLLAPGMIALACFVMAYASMQIAIAEPRKSGGPPTVNHLASLRVSKGSS